MKYLRYISIVAFTLFRKVFGLVWYYFAVPFRHYANNVVFNYVLQNDVHLKRLKEKKITLDIDYYKIAAGHGSTGGVIKYRKISYIEYFLVYWIVWGWLDADSYCDTTSESFLKEWSDGTRGTKDNKECLAKCRGNSFDRGDSIESNFCFVMSSLWNVRNTAYNFKYMQWENVNPARVFLIKLGSYEFGWKAREGSKAEYVNGQLNYDLVCGK